MKVLALDPGAKRMGWAVVKGNGTDAPQFIRSGIEGLTRGNETYHEHRMMLINHFEDWAGVTLSLTQPDVVVNELLPVKGFNDMSQALLAATALTVIQTIAVKRGYIVAQVSSQRVKNAMASTPRATKVAVRNGVIDLLPQLKATKLSKWTKEFDEPDAIAVGLTYLGYENSG